MIRTDNNNIDDNLARELWRGAGRFSSLPTCLDGLLNDASKKRNELQQIHVYYVIYLSALVKIQ